MELAAASELRTMTIAIESPLPRLKWTRDRYHAAYRAGLLPDSIELIDGDIITVPMVCRDPIEDDYTEKTVVKDGMIKLVRLPDILIDAAELNRRVFG